MPVFWWSGPILLALGQDPLMSELAQDYLRIAGVGILPALLVMALKSFLSALERARDRAVGDAGGCGAECRFELGVHLRQLGRAGTGRARRGDCLAVHPDPDLRGAGALCGLPAALRRFSLFNRFWRPDWQALAQVYRLGWPIGLTGLAEGGLFQASALMMGWIGTIELAAHGIALEVMALTFMVHLGLSNAATVRVGRAVGQGDAQGLRDGAVTAIADVRGLWPDRGRGAGQCPRTDHRAVSG